MRVDVTKDLVKHYLEKLEDGIVPYVVLNKIKIYETMLEKSINNTVSLDMDDFIFLEID